MVFPNYFRIGYLHHLRKARLSHTDTLTFASRNCPTPKHAGDHLLRKFFFNNVRLGTWKLRNTTRQVFANSLEFGRLLNKMRVVLRFTFM